MPVGKAAPPRPRSPESVTSWTMSAGAHRERALQALVAVVRQVVVEADRIGDADARERQTLLLREVRNRLDRADAQRVRAAVEKIGVEQAADVARRHGPVADATRSRAATSTSGSSQHMPRVPLRTIVTSSLARRRFGDDGRATSSAPSDSAAASRGT